LWLLARDEAWAEELRARFPRSRTLAADLSAPGSIRSRLAAGALPERLDSLVHVAGVVESGREDELSANVWQDTLAVNLIAPAELTGLLLPALREGRGHVVFVNSGAGVHAPARLSAYAASKFGLKALAESLRAEEYAHGVRVTTVYPREADTPMQVKLHEQFGLPYEPQAHIELSFAGLPGGSADPRNPSASDETLKIRPAAQWPGADHRAAHPATTELRSSRGRLTTLDRVSAVTVSRTPGISAMSSQMFRMRSSEAASRRTMMSKSPLRISQMTTSGMRLSAARTSPPRIRSWR
jgi:NAD(P)-dependent dehydrogenase (short-subunit alcohol dehydrogenase family)